MERLNYEALKPAAAEAFAARIREAVQWIPEHCWVANLENRLKEVRRCVETARKMGVTSVRSWTDEEIAGLVEDLTSLRTLKMVDQAREHLITALVATGIPKSECLSASSPKEGVSAETMISVTE